MGEIIKKVTSGIPGLDKYIGGGIIENCTLALYGSSGSGKTMFLIQYLFEGLKNGESGIYVNVKYPLKETRRMMRYLGYDPEPFEQSGYLVFIDLVSTSKKEERVRYIEDNFFTDKEEIIPHIFIETASQMSEISEKGRAVIDSYSCMMTSLSTDPVRLMRDFNGVHSEHNISIIGTFDRIDQHFVEIAKTYSGCFFEMNCDGKDCLFSIKRLKYSPIKMDLKYKLTDSGVVITGVKKEIGVA